MTIQDEPNTCNKTPRVKLTLITSTTPEHLTKFAQYRNEKFSVTGGGIMTEGRAEVLDVDGLEGLAKVIPALKTSQALCYGVPPEKDIRIITKAKWEADGHPEGAYTRTSDTFRWPAGPAFMMFDYDPVDGEAPLTRDELVARLRSAVPALENIAMLWWPSASSNIYHLKTDEQFTDIRGQRLIICVKEGQDINRAAGVICAMIWAAGFGYLKISKAGRFLDVPLFDRSVWQTNRFDFAAGARCGPSLVQRRDDPMIVDGEIQIIDTKKELPEPSEEVKRAAESNRRDEEEKNRYEAERQKRVWIEERLNNTIGVRSTREQRGQAENTLHEAVDRGILRGDFVITIVDKGQKRNVTIGEVLDDPSKYHRKQTLDPLEPEYRGEKVVGILYLFDGRPTLFSQAHGGCSYALRRQPLEITIHAGQMRAAVDLTADILNDNSEVYRMGDTLVVAGREQVQPVTVDGLVHLLGGLIQYSKTDHQGDLSPINPPPPLVKQLMAPDVNVLMKQIDAIVTAATLRPADGTVLSEPGYDAHSKLLLHTDAHIIPVSDAPTIGEVKVAVEALWHPFKDFPFIGPMDKAVMMCALLTAVVRPSIPTSPAFGFDAATVGSGKTLLSTCIGILATGQDVGVYPPARDEDEIRKRLTSFLRTGGRVMIIDNMLGDFNSAAMASYLTSAIWRDRILGHSEQVNLPNRSMVILNGNNLSIFGDMTRRVLTCRIDPEMELPIGREFDLEPSSYVRVNRHKLVAAALTIIRGFLVHGGPTNKTMPSFPEWDVWVRQPVVWLNEAVCPDEFGDVIELVIENQANDATVDELGEILELWFEAFGDTWVKVREVLMSGSAPNRSAHNDLRSALRALKGNIELSTRRLGKILMNRRGRIASGLRLECKKDGDKHGHFWRVARV